MRLRRKKYLARWKPERFSLSHEIYVKTQLLFTSTRGNVHGPKHCKLIVVEEKYFMNTVRILTKHFPECWPIYPWIYVNNVEFVTATVQLADYPIF